MARISAGTSAAVSALLHARGDSFHRETKTGSYVYDDSVSTYHEWEFRTRLRLAGKKGDGYVDAISKVVEGLRGDAFIVAQEVGLDRLWKTVGEPSLSEEGLHGFETSTESGVNALIKAMKIRVFPYTTHEAKELFRHYTKPSGALSRQVGESMTQYISRRSRCWKLLKELDPELELSEGHRADLLLDLAGLDQMLRIMVQASINNVREFDKVAEALQLQHPRIHISESQRRASHSHKGAGKGHSARAKVLARGRPLVLSRPTAVRWR